jgi:HEAT repeat protein
MFAPLPLPRKLGAALRDVAHEKPEVRLSALADLTRHARSGESQAIWALAGALSDSSEEVRAQAAVALADAGAEAHIPRLIEAATSDVSARVRQMALLALGELAPPEHAGAIAALLGAQRAAAAPERFQALLGLHQLGAPRAQQAIIEGTVDPDPEVRRLSFRIAEAEWADSELPALVHARARAALSDARETVSVAAALLLGHFGDSSGKHWVLALIAGRVVGASVEDQQAAIELSGALGLAEAVPLLERRARSFLGRDPLSFHARVALARLGDERAITSILRGLEAWTFDARTLAVAAAGRAGLVQAKERIVALGERVDAAAAREALALLEQAASRAHDSAPEIEA